jgi:hypothetical protein
MKTIIRLSAACILCAWCFSLQAQQKDVPKEMIGKWSYSFEDPQSGQISTGFCTIQQEKKSTTAIFDLDYYGTITTTPFRPNENGKFYADIEVQGYPITVAFNLIDKNLTCDMISDAFELAVQLKKVEE